MFSFFDHADLLLLSYVEAYNMMRGITGVGQGKGPIISLHDILAEGLPVWAGSLTGGDRVALDMHPYFAFGGGPAADPINVGTGVNAGGTWPTAACQRWATGFNTTHVSFLFLGSYSDNLYAHQPLAVRNNLCWRV